MVRDTRWMYPRTRPTLASQRACADIAALLAEPPANRSADELLAEREQLRREDEARRASQGELLLRGGV